MLRCLPGVNAHRVNDTAVEHNAVKAVLMLFFFYVIETMSCQMCHYEEQLACAFNSQVKSLESQTSVQSKQRRVFVFVP